MQLRVNDNLVNFSQETGMPIEAATLEITKALIAAGFLNDSSSNYGETLEEAINPDADALLVIETIMQFANGPLSCDAFELLMMCVVMGDGDCSECGGEMKLIDCDSRCIPSHDRDIPDEYEPIREIYECPICGEQRIIDYE